MLFLTIHARPHHPAGSPESNDDPLTNQELEHHDDPYP
jgi:hypothetical protein